MCGSSLSDCRDIWAEPLEICKDTFQYMLDVSAKRDTGSTIQVLSIFSSGAGAVDAFMEELYPIESVDENETNNRCTSTEDVVLWLWSSSTTTPSLFVVTMNEMKDPKKVTSALSLLFLLSSRFLYVSQGPIDDKTIDSMQWLKEMAQHLTFYPNQDPDTVGHDLPSILPDCLFLSREFKSKYLQDNNTMDEYFQRAFQSQDGFQQEILDRNQIRELFLHYFQTHDCMSLAPSGNKELYLTQLAKLQRRLEAETPAYVMQGYQCTCMQWGSLLTSYLTQLNNDSVPCIRSAVQTMVREMCEMKRIEAVSMYEMEFETYLKLKPILNSYQFMQVHFHAFEKAQQVIESMELMKKDRSLMDSFRETLLLDIKMIRTTFAVENQQASKTLCETLLHKLPEFQTNWTENGSFSEELKNALVVFKADLCTLLSDYQLKALGCTAADILTAHLLVLLDKTPQWGKQVIDEYRTRMEVVRDVLENEQMAVVTLESTDCSDTSVVVQEQQGLYEKALKDAAEALADERKRCREELEDQKTEVIRVMKRMDKLQQEHEEIRESQRQVLQEMRDKVHELEKEVVTERDRREVDVCGVNRELLESERGFHKEEKNLLFEQKDLMAKVIQLERQLGENTTIHLQKTFEMEQQAQNTYQSIKRGLDEEMVTLKNQSKDDLMALRKAHELAMESVKQQIDTAQANIDAYKDQMKTVSTSPAHRAVKVGDGTTGDACKTC